MILFYAIYYILYIIYLLYIMYIFLVYMLMTLHISLTTRYSNLRCISIFTNLLRTDAEIKRLKTIYS